MDSYGPANSLRGSRANKSYIRRDPPSSSITGHRAAVHGPLGEDIPDTTRGASCSLWACGTAADSPSGRWYVPRSPANPVESAYLPDQRPSRQSVPPPWWRPIRLVADIEDPQLSLGQSRRAERARRPVLLPASTLVWQKWDALTPASAIAAGWVNASYIGRAHLYAEATVSKSPGEAATVAPREGEDQQRSPNSRRTERNSIDCGSAVRVCLSRSRGFGARGFSVILRRANNSPSPRRLYYPGPAASRQAEPDLPI